MADPVKYWPELVSGSSDERERKSSEFLDAQISFAAPKRLMTALRDLMADLGLPPEKKLDEIVRLVAAELRADDCACHILRAGEVLELYSSSTLAPEACTEKLRVGEGAVGDVAAAAAPIVDRAEDGAYKAFCGVPILRGGRVRGVRSLRI